MNSLLDEIARTLGTSIPRRHAIRSVGRLLASATLATLTARRAYAALACGSNTQSGTYSSTSGSCATALSLYLTSVGGCPSTCCTQTATSYTCVGENGNSGKCGGNCGISNAVVTCSSLSSGESCAGNTTCCGTGLKCCASSSTCQPTANTCCGSSSCASGIKCCGTICCASGVRCCNNAGTACGVNCGASNCCSTAACCQTATGACFTSSSCAGT